MVVRALRAVLALLVATASVGLGLLLATSAPAAACECSPQTFERQVKRADVVFLATVDSVSKDSAGHTYALTATRAYQGSVEHSTSAQSPPPAECGLGELQVGEEYVFTASGSAAPYAVSACDGTAKATPERVTKVEDLLDEGTVISPPPPPEAAMTRVEDAPPPGFARLAAPGAAAVLLGLLGLFVVRRLARA